MTGDFGIVLGDCSKGVYVVSFVGKRTAADLMGDLRPESLEIRGDGCFELGVNLSRLHFGECGDFNSFRP